MDSVNQRSRYYVTSPAIGRAQTQKDPRAVEVKDWSWSKTTKCDAVQKSVEIDIFHTNKNITLCVKLSDNNRNSGAYKCLWNDKLLYYSPTPQPQISSLMT